MRLGVILFVFLLSANAGSEPGLLCQEVPILMFNALKVHIAKHELNADMRARTANVMLKTLDPSKQFLLKSDEKKIRNDIQSLFNAMVIGDCSRLRDIWETVAARTRETRDLVKKLLPSFTVDKTVKFQSDAKKRDYPLNAKAKQSLINAIVQVQVATIMAGDVPLEKAKEQLLKRYELLLKKVQETKESEQLNTFLESFARSLDPHSDYLSVEELDEFKLAMSLSLEGVGLRVAPEDGYTVVQEVTPGTSADRSHAFLPQDKIIAVAQERGDAVSVIDMELDDVLKKIRGPKGTKVTLTVLRQKGGQNETFSVELVRDKVDLDELAARVVYETRVVNNRPYKIAIVNLPSFYGSNEKNARDSYADLKAVVEDASAKKVDGMVLDLSTNPGGLLNNVVKIAGLFIRTGSVVAVRDANQKRSVLFDEDPNVAYTGPLMILTTRLSASASEILAGALKDYRRALIVGGDHTFGKGSVQDLIPLPEGRGMLKLTTRMFFLPGGETTQYQGVAANITVPSAFDLDDFSESRQDYALRPSQDSSFITTAVAQSLESGRSWKPVSDQLVDYLKKRSAVRLRKSPEFKEIRKEVDEAKRDNGLISVAELLGKSQKDKAKAKTRREEARTAAGRQALWLKDARMQEALNIMEDWLTVPNNL